MSNSNNKSSVNVKKFKYFDIYISYHPAQRIPVEHICQQFKQFNLRVWYDKDSLHEETENEFDENIQALQSSFLFICFPSDEYQKKLKNRIEFSIAAEQEMRMISLNLDGFPASFNSSTVSQIKLTEQIIEPEQEKELSSLIKYLKNEVNQVSQTFKQSYKNTVSAWYDALGRNSVLKIN